MAFVRGNGRGAAIRTRDLLNPIQVSVLTDPRLVSAVRTVMPDEDGPNSLQHYRQRAVTTWRVVPKFEPAAARLADGHYSRRTVGSPQFMPPGQTLVLLTPDELAVFGWWRPHPSSGIRAMNGLEGWTCTIFRNTGPHLSSRLILEAEAELLSRYDCGPDGLLTYVWDRKVRSVNPGYCFKVAGWKAIGRSADGRKTLLQKPAALEKAA